MSLNERDALLSRLLRQGWPHETLLNALSLPKTLDILDVGAGEGKLLNFLASQGHLGRLTGLDPQPGPGVQVGVVESLPFPAHSFDVVFMVRMLTHCRNSAKAIQEARRVLRPGGQLVIAVHGKEHLQTLMRGSSARQGPEDDVQDILQHLKVERQDVKRSVSLSFEEARTVLNSYGRPTELTDAPFPLREMLHLSIFQGSFSR